MIIVNSIATWAVVALALMLSAGRRPSVLLLLLWPITAPMIFVGWIAYQFRIGHR